MSNGITISKDAFLNAGGGDKNKQRDAQREMLFDATLHLVNKIDNLADTITRQTVICKKEFASRSEVKVLSWGFRILYSAIIVGAVGALIKVAMAN